MLRFTATLYDANHNCVNRHTFDTPFGTTSRRAWSEARALFGLTGVKGDFDLNEWKPRGMGGLSVRLECSYLLK
jgi:hypothetical protein